jgi:hypothetical protein
MMNCKKSLQQIVGLALWMVMFLACQFFQSSPTPIPPTSTPVPTNTPKPTLTATRAPGQVFSTDVVLKIPGIAKSVGSGDCIFSKAGETGKSNVKISGTIPVLDGVICLCCVETITIGPKMKIQLNLFTPKKQPGASTSLNLSLSWDDTEEPNVYILSGPEGAKLKKVEDGFLLIEGEAFFVKK